MARLPVLAMPLELCSTTSSSVPSPSSSSCGARSSAWSRSRSAAAPVGVFLMLRRMSLTGDAMAHAILPGAARRLSRRRAVAAGDDASAASLAGVDRRGRWPASSRAFTALKEDASLAAFYLLSLALGVTHRVAARLERRPAARAVRHRAGARRQRPSAARLDRHRHRRWRSPCSTGRSCSNASTRSSCARSAAPATPTHLVFLGLVVLNLVGGFQALGTLLAVGMMMLPAAAVALLERRHHR